MSRALTAIVLVGLTGPAIAAPIATLAADVDGDGIVDRLELGADGMLRGHGELRLAPEATAGTLALSRASKQPVVVATIATAKGKLAVVVANERGTWRELARVDLGAANVDQDFTYDVDADPRWLVRYQRVPGAERCDGKPARLFPETLDVATRTWRAIKPPIDVDEHAPVLAARPDPAAFVPPLVYKAHLASHEPGAPDAGALPIPAELDDGKLETVWTEALDSDGKGQFFTFEPRTTGEPAKAIRIVPGDPRSAAAMKAANRPRRIAIVAAGHAWWAELPDPLGKPLGTAYVIDLPAATEGCVTVILDAVYAGDANATSIAELEVYAERERGAGGGEALLAHALAEGTGNLANLTAILAAHGAAGARAIADELAKTTDHDTRRRLVHALVQNHDPAASAPLVQAAREGWVTGAELLEVIDALGAFHEAAALDALARDPKLALDARVAAIHLLRASDPAALALLLDLLRRPNLARELRGAVIDALATAPPEALVRATGAGAPPDVWRAITKQLRTSTDAGARAAAITVMTAALAEARDYEVRYRLVDGLATLGDAAALRGLDGYLRALATSAPAAAAEAAALRQVAIRAIASAPRPAGVPIVVALARDPDPGVRMTALVALATVDAEPAGPWHAAQGPEGIDRVIASALAVDHWPEVRRRAAQALGQRCTRAMPATALVTAVQHDHAIAVRIDALAALVECRAAGVGALLAHTWDDGKAPVELRAYAVDLAVVLGDPALGPVLVDRFGTWQNRVPDSPAALELAQHAAPAIGRLAPPDALEVLVDALNDTAYPELVSAAALGLAELGPKCTAAAKRKLLAIGADDEALAIVARRAAARCGK